ncbi:MAG: right-handed parallel beta-helix repeat-containing protein [Bacteroidales bacterium]|nr:right-handed parallel beta-helix repeat-containing protein [Bacteroidales bacterium]
MKKIASITMLMAVMTIFYSVYSQTVINSAELKGTLTRSNAPYIVLRDVTVPTGETLIIEPGVELQFVTSCGLTVEGGLSAVGTDADRIRFTSADTAEVKIDSTKGWNGITIRGPVKDTVRMENCILNYVSSNGAQYSYEAKGALSVYNRYAIINKCTISKCYGYSNGGIYWGNEADGIIQNCIIRDNASFYYGGINIDRAHALVINNLIADNGTGLMIRSSNTAKDTVKVYNNTIAESTNKYRWMGKIVGVEYGLADFFNTIITGESSLYEPEIIDIYHSDHVSFENCIIEKGQSNIQSESSFVTLHDVFTAQPYFAFESGYVLSDSSAAINSGENLPPDILSLIPFDLAGNPRIFDGTTDRIDIGAFEYQGDLVVNRAPSIVHPGTKHLFVSTAGEMKFNFSDADETDTHTLSVTTDNPNITLGALSSQTNDATYTVSPLAGWSGEARIFLSVADNHGGRDADTFSLVVSDTVNYDITENTTWEKDTVYIGSSFTVLSDVTLDIKAGTCVIFNDNHRIYNQGVIRALGTASDKIVFTSLDTSGFSAQTHKGWGGIAISNNRDKSVFNNCIFEFAKDLGILEMGENASADIVNCIVRYNGLRTAFTGSEAIIEGSKIKLYIGNSVFTDNQSKYAPVFTDDSEITICNSNFYHNSGTFAVVSNRYGGKTAIKNSIFWNNWSRDFIIEAGDQDECVVSNSVVEGGDNGIRLNGVSAEKEFIYNMYPQFTDSVTRDFHLLSASPCINKGINDPILSGLNNIDLDGNARVYNAVLPDIGVYEYQGDPTNRKPVITAVEDKTSMLGIPVTGTVSFSEADEGDTHTITVSSLNAQVTVQNLSGDTTGSVYTLVPDPGYSGDAIISVMVEDNGGLRDSISYTLHVSTSACGAIEEDMAWDRDTVNVDCDVIVKAGATLTIDPGIKVIFNGPYSLTVYGTIKALGNINDSILFTDPDSSWTGIILKPAAGQDTSVLRYCEIRHSKAGGVYLQNPYKNIIRVSGCFIHHNYNASLGGGIYMYGESISIENCNISHNNSDRMGGGIYTGGMGSKIVNNVISDNQSRQGGNGIYSSANYNTGSIIEGNLIQNNLSINSYEGIYSSNDTIRNNIIRNNTGDGIRAYIKSYICNNLIEGNSRSGIYMYVGSFDVLNNIISNNDKGILMRSTGGLIANNTICKNRYSGKGSGVDILRDSAAVFVNNIIYGNGSPDAESQVNISQMPLPVKIDYCVVEGGKEGISFSTDITYLNEYYDIIYRNPFFSDFANNDFSLSDSSVCINSGSPDTAGMNLPALDFAGNSRIYNGAINRIDIGAVEYTGEPVNRPPVLTKTPDVRLFVSRTKQMKVEFSDADNGNMHTISVTSNEAQVTINNLSGNISGSTYDLVPATGWKGVAQVKVKVEDNAGLADSAEYTVEVGNNACGDLTENTVWDVDTVYVTCNVKVPEGKMLTIMPGTVVIGNSSCQINVYGTLNATGTEADRITFVSADTATSNPNYYWKGISFYDKTISEDTSKLIRCNFKYGQHVVIATEKVLVSNCYFAHCSTSIGGALLIQSSSPVVENSVFAFNNASSNGGAIAMEGSDYIYNIRPVIRGNRFYSNRASIGGSIFSGNINPDIMHNYFYNNNATAYGGAIYIAYSRDINLTNNLIYRNSASQGGGAISLYEGRGQAINNTIVMNTANTGGAFNYGRYSRIFNTNNVIYHNRSTGAGQQIYYNANVSLIALNNCILQGGKEAMASDKPSDDKLIYRNTFDAGPFFIDTLNNDYRLSDSSYCINAGRLIAELPLSDIDGNTRVYSGLLANVDIGAYEYPGFPRNRKPLMDAVPDQYTDVGVRKTVNVIFRDVDKTDTHTITILSGDGNVTVENLSGNTSGSVYDLVPATGWSGNAEITVKVEDNSGSYATDTYFLFVADTHPPVVSNPLPDTTAYVGESFTYAIPENSFTDADPDDSLSYSAMLAGNEQLPVWLSFNDQTITFTGIPTITDIGMIVVVVTVTDKSSSSVKDTFTITVKEVTAIESPVYNPINIYPVPARESVCIEFPLITGHEEITVTLYDFYGKRIDAVITKGENLITIDVSALPTGMYYVRVRANKDVKTYKIPKN